MDPARLSPREREVLDLLGDHLTHIEIARRLFISVRTVETHVASMRRKLQLADHRTLVRLAVSRRASLSSHAPASAGGARPAPATSFVGRRVELAELAEALTSERVVSAVGPGGVGKTRLALAAVEQVEGQYPGGVHWVDLVPLNDPRRLDDVVAAAVGASVSSRVAAADAVVAALRDRPPVLLGLDNGEHVVNALAVLVDRLVAACPRLTVLVTSRIRLALPVEHVFAVHGMATAPDGDAVALFLTRALAAGSRPQDIDELERIGAVCTALDGLALAVELAAVRMPSLGLDGLEHGLMDQATLLVGVNSTQARHRSMGDTIDWSVSLLNPVAATALRRLAVFVAPFGVEAAHAVTGFAQLSPGDVRAALATLTEHNLLTTTTVDDRFAYRMLEPVRQYAAARMTGRDRHAYALHLAWCRSLLQTAMVAVDLADPASPPDDEPAASATLGSAQSPDRVLARVGDDVRAALAWAAALVDSGEAAGGAQDDAGGHSATGRTEVAADAEAVARDFGLLCFRAGDLLEAQRWTEQAARVSGDDHGAAGALSRAAAVAKCRVLGEEALRLERAAAQRYRAAEDAVASALALTRAAELLTRFPGMFSKEPDAASATHLLAEAKQLAPDDARVTAAIAVATVGSAGPDESIRDRARAALEAARAVDDVVLESAAMDALTGVALFAGDVLGAHRIARQRLARLLPWADEPDAGLELKDALHVAAFCAVGAGDLATASEMGLRQRRLPFLREHRDLADDELLAPAALTGDWATVLAGAERFLADWTAAGSPCAPGRGLAPAAVALAHGLRGNTQARGRWLRVLARIRGVPLAQASRGTGFGELFDAMVHLQDGHPRAARDVLTAADGSSLYGQVFRQWSAAVLAEASVLIGAPDGAQLVRRAREASRGNPVATAITDRAEALAARDEATLRALADSFSAAGLTYQEARTRSLIETVHG